MHDVPMQTGRPNGVRSSDWLDTFIALLVTLIMVVSARTKAEIPMVLLTALRLLHNFPVCFSFLRLCKSMPMLLSKQQI